MKVFGKFKNLSDSLKKTKEALSEKITSIFSSVRLNSGDLERLEEALILSDISLQTANEIIDGLKERVLKFKGIGNGVQRSLNQSSAGPAASRYSEAHPTLLTEDTIKSALKGEIKSKISKNFPAIKINNGKNIFLIVGVNGAGKTTTVAKLGKYYTGMGRKVIIAACDTFRAAGKEQLEIWGGKTNTLVISGRENQDPASVAHDAVQKLRDKDFDLLIIDTAGRLHNKRHLMEELSKINRIVSKTSGNPPDETLIVIDASLGQNSLVQVEQFKEFIDISGVIITKLDGSAKGGIIIDIIHRLNLPVRFVGTGESADKISEFSPEIFVDSLF